MVNAVCNMVTMGKGRPLISSQGAKGHEGTAEEEQPLFTVEGVEKVEGAAGEVVAGGIDWDGPVLPLVVFDPNWVWVEAIEEPSSLFNAKAQRREDIRAALDGLEFETLVGGGIVSLTLHAANVSGLVESTSGSPLSNPYLFTGRRVDWLDGGAKPIQINRHRTYDYETGRWLSADPLGVVQGDYRNGFYPLGQYADGGNLWEYVQNDPVEKADPSRLAFYAIGGTWERQDDGANPSRLEALTQEERHLYFQGPGFTFGLRDPIMATHGLDSLAIARHVKNQICADFCEAKRNCKVFTINLTGWSRGAVIAMGVALDLDLNGCKCKDEYCDDHYRPVEVNWIGLFDAVEMVTDPRTILPGDQGFSNNVPGNVKNFAHAIKTGTKEPWFPTTRYGINEKSFNRYDGKPTTHGDIGNSFSRNNNESFDWILHQAIIAGVKF